MGRRPLGASPEKASGAMINGDRLLADLRDIFYTHQAEWLSLSQLVADLKLQPYAAYHARTFYERPLKLRLAEFEIVTVRRGIQAGIEMNDLLGRRIRCFAPGAARIVRVISDFKEEADGPSAIA
jgi:hypothetical protein